VSTIAIVCEYNPFHNGHKFQIEAHKKLLNAGGVIAIMSGNFVQRGAPAICDKWHRTKMALLSGADLVLELPTVFATQSAERFAKGAVGLADGLGVVDYLSFGCECNDVELLNKAVYTIEKKETKEKIAELLKEGINYPSARMIACGDEFSEVLSKPNNILAIEYLKALAELKSDIRPVPLLRMGCEHDEDKPHGEFASASYIRKCIAAGEDFSNFIPDRCVRILEEADILIDTEKLDAVITYLLRTKSPDEISSIADMTEGIQYRFKKAGSRFTTTEEIAEFVKTKRYTKTRIDRLIINLLLSIKKEDITKKPEYIRVLGFNERGKRILSKIKKKSLLPIITKTADAALSEEGMKMLEKDIYATDIYSMLCMEKETSKSGLDYIKSPIVIK